MKESNSWLFPQFPSAFTSDVNGHMSQRRSTANDNYSVDVAVGRAHMEASSIGSGKAHKSGKAMRALDKTTARKVPVPMHLTQQSQLSSQRHLSQCQLNHDGVPADEEARRDYSDDDSIQCLNDLRIMMKAGERGKHCYADEIQLMMKTGPCQASNKHRHGRNCTSIDNTDKDGVVQSGRKSDSRKRK